jgi:hypothetical protein
MLCFLGITATGGFRLEYFLRFGIWCSIGWDVGGSSSLILGVQRVGNFAICSLELVLDLVLVLVWSLLLRIGGAVMTLGLPIFGNFVFLVMEAPKFENCEILALGTVSELEAALFGTWQSIGWDVGDSSSSAAMSCRLGGSGF